jgi:hypothetical protein
LEERLKLPFKHEFLAETYYVSARNVLFNVKHATKHLVVAKSKESSQETTSIDLINGISLNTRLL